MSMSVRKTGGGAAIGASDMAGKGAAVGDTTKENSEGSSKKAPVGEEH